MPKYRDCTTSNGFELYLMSCGEMLLSLLIYILNIYIYYIISWSILVMWARCRSLDTEIDGSNPGSISMLCP